MYLTESPCILLLIMGYTDIFRICSSPMLLHRCKISPICNACGSLWKKEIAFFDAAKRVKHWSATIPSKSSLPISLTTSSIFTHIAWEKLLWDLTSSKYMLLLKSWFVLCCAYANVLAIAPFVSRIISSLATIISELLLEQSRYWSNETLNICRVVQIQS